MTRTVHIILLGLLGLLAALLSSCAEDEQTPDPTRAYLSDTWGITLTGFEGLSSDRFEIREDGTAVTRGEGTIRVDALGTRALAVDEEVAPQSSGGATTAIIAEAGGDISYLSYEPMIGRLAFGDLTTEMGIDANPDGTFRVWRFSDALEADETIATTDGVGSYQHVEANGGLEDDSPYLLLMAVALGHAPVYEARVWVRDGTQAVASSLVACETFKAFCDCVACHALDGVGCDACPTLDR